LKCAKKNLKEDELNKLLLARHNDEWSDDLSCGGRVLYRRGISGNIEFG
jgi:hypothetical protein